MDLVFSLRQALVNTKLLRRLRVTNLVLHLVGLRLLTEVRGLIVCSLDYLQRVSASGARLDLAFLGHVHAWLLLFLIANEHYRLVVLAHVGRVRLLRDLF